jgi:hypothetical protein
MFVAGDSVAAKDISAFALKRLTALDFRGVNVQYLLGARDVTYRETAQIIGNAIGKSDLTYMEFPFAEYKKGFMQMGATESLADNINEFVQAMNHGRVSEDYTRNAENTTPTTLEGFAQAFAYVYHHA